MSTTAIAYATGIGLLLGVVAWWLIASRASKARMDAARRLDGATSETKRNLDTALGELRDLRDALTPAEHGRVERRRADSLGLQGRTERRKPKARP